MFLAFERLADTDLFVAVALGVFAFSASFLVLVAVAASRRFGGRAVGGTLAAALCGTAGASVGTMLLLAPDAVVAAPLVLVLGALVIGTFRAGRRVQSGWLLLGTGLSIAVPWLLAVLGRGFLDDAGAVAWERPAWLGLGLALAAVGAILAARGDATPPAPSMAAPAGRPGSRHLGSIAAAIREPGMVGPFGLPEIAMLAAFVAMWLAVPFWIPRDAHILIQYAVPGIVAAIAGTEAYVRSMPPRSRRAFEAFSWLGEWELARARQITGKGVPTSPAEARRWLAERPERVDRLDEAALRVEILLLAERLEEARALVARMEARAASPWERFEVAALQDLVGWRAGGDGDLPAMQAAAEAILPPDSDERLRAEVTIAVARVRRRMADGRATPGDAVEPLLEVRELLGARADGQVGRALRPRLLPLLLVLSVIFAVGAAAVGTLGGVPPI
jgi:hypothetical protein